MALHLPLFYRSGSTVFLDDDPDYLEMLGMVLPAHLQVELYMRPSTFLDRMREEPARWEADAALHLLMIDRWRNGHHLLPQLLAQVDARAERRVGLGERRHDRILHHVHVLGARLPIEALGFGGGEVVVGVGRVERRDQVHQLFHKLLALRKMQHR
jgi:hypothetical protein